MKQAVETLIAPAKEEPKDVTTKLKATVGELRQLSNKKAGLQGKVDTAKEHYKLLLDELKGVQDSIDKEQQQLTAQSEAQAKLPKKETSEAADAELPEIDQDTNHHVFKAMAQVCILFTDTRKAELERDLAENLLKHRQRHAELPRSG